MLKKILLLSLLLIIQACNPSSNKKVSGASTNVFSLCAEESNDPACNEEDVILKESGNNTQVTPPITTTSVIAAEDTPDGDSVNPISTVSPYQSIKAYWEVMYEASLTKPKEIDCEGPQSTSVKKGTITLAGGKNIHYFPRPLTATLKRQIIKFENNTSPHLMLVSKAKQFYEGDDLQVRFKIRPQPVTKKNEPFCLKQKKVKNTEMDWGYTVLQYSVSLIPLDEKGILQIDKKAPKYEHTQTYETNTYTCSKLLSFSEYKEKYKYGFVLAIHDVKSDRACWYSKTNRCKGFEPLPSNTCWQMDVEAYTSVVQDIDEIEYSDQDGDASTTKTSNKKK